MKILQICRQFPPVVGGLPNAAYSLSKALHQAGHHVEVVTLNSAFATGELLETESVIDGIQIHRLHHIGSKRYPIALDVLSYVSDFDVLHVHAIDFFVDFLSLSRMWHQKPLVVTTHGGIFHTQWLLPLKQLYFKSLTRLSLCGADAVICVSKHDYDLFRPIVKEQKLHTLMGIDLQPFFSLKKQIVPGLLLGIGRISENKGIERLINLLPELVKDFPNIQLVWIGKDPEQLMTKLISHAQRLGVASRVKFIGEVSNQQMWSLLSQAHLFVSAASYEAFGISTIEAMSSATVPVVTAVGVHPEVIKEEQTGFICNFEDESAVNCFRYALSLDVAQLNQIGQNAREATMQFSWSNVVSSYINIYHSLLNKQPTNRLTSVPHL